MPVQRFLQSKNKRQPREALQKKEIYHINKDIRITYTGLELRADDDELVWQQVLEYAKRKPIGAPITFSFYELCQDLGWSYNGRYIEKAEECLTRLQATAMQFISDRIGQLDSVSLIGRFKVLDRGKRSSQCEVIIDKEMILLFLLMDIIQSLFGKSTENCLPLPAACLTISVPTVIRIQ